MIDVDLSANFVLHKEPLMFRCSWPWGSARRSWKTCWPSFGIFNWNWNSSGCSRTLTRGSVGGLMGWSVLEGNISGLKKGSEHLEFRKGSGMVGGQWRLPDDCAPNLENFQCWQFLGQRGWPIKSKMAWESMCYYAKWAPFLRSCKQSKAPHCERADFWMLSCPEASSWTKGMNKIQDWSSLRVFSPSFDFLVNFYCGANKMHIGKWQVKDVDS